MKKDNVICNEKDLQLGTEYLFPEIGVRLWRERAFHPKLLKDPLYMEEMQAVLEDEYQYQYCLLYTSPYAMQPQSIMEDQESRRELYDGLKRLTQREQTYLLYRYGFTCLLYTSNRDLPGSDLRSRPLAVRPPV